MKIVIIIILTLLIKMQINFLSLYTVHLCICIPRLGSSQKLELFL